MPVEPTRPALPGPGAPEPVPDDRAVLDRIVDDTTAVLLVGPDEMELHVPAASLPDGTQDGTWLTIDLDGDTPRITGIDHTRTDDRHANLESRLSHLRATRSRGRFQRDDTHRVPPGSDSP